MNYINYIEYNLVFVKKNPIMHAYPPRATVLNNLKNHIRRDCRFRLWQMTNI